MPADIEPPAGSNLGEEVSPHVARMVAPERFASDMPERELSIREG
jgi:hypothetical protein